MQMAGHLRGRALQKWDLILSEDKPIFADAVKSLSSRLDLVDRVLAGQVFRHAMQEGSESVADFVRRLERLFQIAYGLSVQTRDTLLYSQLQEGLRYSLIKSPAVSGADSYKQLCIAAKHEEKRLSELVCRQQYLKDGGKKVEQPQQAGSSRPTERRGESRGESRGEARSCYVCGSADHLARQCKKRKTESSGQLKRPSEARAKGIRSKENPLDSLHPDLDDGSSDIRTVRIQDRGSKPREVMVDVQGVPATGVIDSGADITIMGAELFKKVASVARLRRSSFNKPDKTSYTYDHQPFSLDGKLELDITFDDHTMRTPVYVKMDAHDPLLL